MRSQWGVADAHHGVGLQCGKLSGVYASAGQQLDHQPSPLVRIGGQCGHELGCSGVVEELRQRLVVRGEATGKIGERRGASS